MAENSKSENNRSGLFSLVTIAGAGIAAAMALRFVNSSHRSRRRAILQARGNNFLSVAERTNMFFTEFPETLVNRRNSEAWRALQELREFYEWKDYAEKARQAITEGTPLPSRPNISSGVQTITERLELLHRMVSDARAPRIPPPIDPERFRNSPDLPERLQRQIAINESNLANLRSQNQFIQDVAQMVRDLTVISDQTGRFLNEALERGLPDVGQVVTGIIFDLIVTIPRAAAPVSSMAAEVQRDVVDALARESTRTEQWNTVARRIAENYDFNAWLKARQDSLREASGGARSALGPERRGSGGGIPQGTIFFPPTPVEHRLIVSIPSEGVQVEVWLIPAALDLRRPPDNPPVIIPPGGEIFAMAAFPGQEARIRIVALGPNGRRVAGFSLSGSGGGTPQRRWKNSSKDIVTIHASATNIIDQPIRLSSYDAFQELTVLGWGLEVIPDRSPVGRGPKTHDAVLMIVRSDDSPSDNLSVGPGVEIGTLRVFERDEQLFVVGFPNRRARVEFQGTGSDSTPRAFWRTLIGSSGQINRNLFRNIDDVLTIDFKASTADSTGQWRPIAWQGVRINADLIIAGAGFQPMEQADNNLPYRVVLFAVRVP